MTASGSVSDNGQNYHLSMSRIETAWVRFRGSDVAAPEGNATPTSYSHEQECRSPWLSCLVPISLGDYLSPVAVAIMVIGVCF